MWQAQIWVKWNKNAPVTNDWTWLKDWKEVQGAWSVMGDWDMLIVDLFLQGGSGMRLVQRVQRVRPEQKIIVFSNYVNAGVRKRCAQLAVDAVFDKSTEIDALVDYCSHLCTQLGAQAALAPEHPSGGPP